LEAVFLIPKIAFFFWHLMGTGRKAGRFDDESD